VNYPPNINRVLDVLRNVPAGSDLLIRVKREVGQQYVGKGMYHTLFETLHECRVSCDDAMDVMNQVATVFGGNGHDMLVNYRKMDWNPALVMIDAQGNDWVVSVDEE
jgi:hypothetical protein